MARNAGRPCWRMAVAVAAVLAAFIAPARANDQTADLQRGAEQLEKAYQWQAAAQAYTRLSQLQPGEPRWAEGARRCQQQFLITRRYSDRSYRDRVLTLDFDKSAELLREVLAYIEANYVEEASLTRMLAQGVENLDLALQNPVARAVLVPSGVNDEAVDRFRQTLRQRWGEMTAKTPKEALEKAQQVAAAARLALRANQTAVIAEFACAACEALDRYSAYLTPDRFARVMALVENDVAGIGLELQSFDGQLIVTKLAADGPAAQAGVQPNDRLLRIDGTLTRQLSGEEAALRLLGPTGTRVALEVQGVMDTLPRHVDVVRRAISAPSVIGARILDAEHGIAYLQLAVFQKNTLEELDLALARLSEEGMRALILDLRGNPGGSFGVAVQVADRFIAEGVLASTRGRTLGSNEVFRAQDGMHLDLQLVVLIDRETASAAELLAGAIKDYHRGILVGQRTYGKGCVQHVFALHTVPAGIRLTTAKFFSPLDTPYSGAGVVPDILIDRTARTPGMESMMGMMDELEVALEAARRLLGKS